MRSKTVIEEMDRGVYDIKNNDEFSFKTDKGLTHEIVDIISTEKNDPQWMREFRHKSLDIYNEIKMVSQYKYIVCNDDPKLAAELIKTIILRHVELEENK